MPDSLQAWAEKVATGDPRAVSRAISAVENGEPSGLGLLKLLFGRAAKAYVIGVTGAPGAGKSTLVEKLAAEYRRSGSRVGIVAVDPTSPFSGGAILGDRIRMQSLAGDRDVFIRSMATRGQLGGLARPVHDVVTVLEAAGCQAVVVETVGVGQDEIEVARLADATVLLLVPGMGDDVQTFKAGVMEIADLFVINKADHAGADRLEQEVTAMLSLAARRDSWQPPILKTVATTGEGIASLREALERFRSSAGHPAASAQRQRDKWRARLMELLRQRLLEKVVAERMQNGALEGYIDEVLARRRDPHSVVEEIVGDLHT
jgi:LAO/AO transport system kinase